MLILLYQKFDKKKDEARMYLNYMFNPLEKFSYYNFIFGYFNNNIDNTDNFIDNTKFNNDLLRPFVDFFDDDLVINCLTIMNNDNRYVTGFVDVKDNILLLSQFLIKLINDNKFDHIKDKNIILLRRCFNIIKKYIKCYPNEMKCYKIHEFYIDILNSCFEIISTNKEIQHLYFDSYFNCLTSSITIEKGKTIKFDYFYKYINTIYINQFEKEYINKIIEWYINLTEEKLTTLYNMYEKLQKCQF